MAPEQWISDIEDADGFDEEEDDNDENDSEEELPAPSIVLSSQDTPQEHKIESNHIRVALQPLDMSQVIFTILTMGSRSLNS